MGATAAAASLLLTVMRTSSEPALARACTWRTVPSTSAVSVLVIDCTTIGAPPPTRTAPIETGTEERRARLRDRRAFYRPRTLGGMPGVLLSCAGRNRSVRRESGASRNAEGAIPPGNAQAPERQTAEPCVPRASGERWTQYA